MYKTTLTSLLLLFLLLLSSCNCNKSQCKDQSHRKDGTIDHIVFLWLQDSGNSALLDSIKVHSRNLDTIPGILSLSMGDAVPSERPVVDDSFNLGLIFSFKNEEDMKNYVTHKGHKDFIEQWIKPNSKKLLIYDIKN